MSQIIETTKLYINGEKVFPVSSDTELVADYTDIGYVPSEVANIKQSYDEILSRKTLDIESVKDILGYVPVAFPDLSMDDYADWNVTTINFNGCDVISFKDDKLNINASNDDLTEYTTVSISNMKILKELNINNFWGYNETYFKNCSELEKVTINYNQVSTSEVPYVWDRRQNLNTTFENDTKLKSLTIHFPEHAFSQTNNLEGMLHECRNLEEFNINDNEIDFGYNNDYNINIGRMFENCESLKTIPRITGFSHVGNASGLFYGVGWKYKDDLTVRTIDYEIDSLSDGNDKELTNLDGMFARCPLIRYLTISTSRRPSNANIFRFDSWWDSGLNFDNSQPMYEENTSNIIGYYIPDLYTQNFCNTVRLCVNSDNVQWYKDRLKEYNNFGSALEWYIDNVFVQPY